MSFEQGITISKNEQSDSVNTDGQTRSIKIRNEENIKNGDKNNLEAEAKAENITAKEISHDFFYCPSPDLNVYDDTILLDDDSSVIGKLPLNNSTSESVIFRFAGQIFNGQHSSSNITKVDDSIIYEENENKDESNDSPIVIISPAVVKSCRFICCRNKSSPNHGIPIHVSPSVTIVQETDNEENEDEIDESANECSECCEDHEEQPSKIQRYQVKEKGVRNKSVRKWRKERPCEDNHQFENPVPSEEGACSFWTSTPRKRYAREREKVSKRKNVSDDRIIHLNRDKYPTTCKNPLERDLEMRCAWHEWQVDYVSLVENGDDLNEETRSFSNDWFALHQPLKEHRNRDEEDEKQKRRDKREIEEVDYNDNEQLSTTMKRMQSKTSQEKVVNMQMEGKFGRREKHSKTRISFYDHFQRETWIKSTDFSGNNLMDRQSKIQNTQYSRNAETLIILNYLKIRNFKPNNRSYTTFFDPSFKNNSPTESNSTEQIFETTKTKTGIWFHFFRFCYSSLPHLSSLDYDYRLEWSDSNRVDHYRLAHPIFIPEALKWVNLLTHPDGATVFGLQEIE